MWHAAHGVTFLAAVLIDATTRGGIRFHPNHRVVIGWKNDGHLPNWWRERTNRHKYLIWNGPRPQLTLLRHWVEDICIPSQSIRWNLMKLHEHLIGVSWTDLMATANELYFAAETYHPPKLAIPKLADYTDARYPFVQTVWYNEPHYQLELGVSAALPGLHISRELDGDPVVQQMIASYLSSTSRRIKVTLHELSRPNLMTLYFSPADNTWEILKRMLFEISRRDSVPDTLEPWTEWLDITSSKAPMHCIAGRNVFKIQHAPIRYSSEYNWLEHPNPIARPARIYKTWKTQRLTHVTDAGQDGYYYLGKYGFWINGSEIDVAL